MRKFARLVGNEIIKLIKKKGTLVMAVLFVASIIGLTGLCKIAAEANSGGTDWQQDAFLEGEVAGNVDYYRYVYEDSILRDENGVLLSYDAEAKAAYEYWKYLQENAIRYDDWLYTEGLYEEYCMMRTALTDGLSDELASEYAARIAAIERYMGEDGWRIFYEDQIKTLMAGNVGGAQEAELWFYRYSLDQGIMPDGGEMHTLLLSVCDAKASLAELAAGAAAGIPVSEEQRTALEDEIALGIYRLDNGIGRDISAEVKNSSLFALSDFTFWSVFAVCKTLIKLVGVMCIVVAGSIVAAEFSQGTYKFLLMSPAKRWKILLSKFAAVLLFGLAALVLLYVLSFLCCMIFFGTSELMFPMLSVQGGEVITGSPMLSVLGDYLLSTVEILSMTMLALAISTLVKGNALAISASLVVFLSGSLLETLLREFGVDFGRYLIFANLNLPALYAGTSFYAGQTFGFAVTVILCHLAVFGLTAWDAFTRREM